MNKNYMTFAENRQEFQPKAAVGRKYAAERTDWWEGVLSRILPLLMAGLDFIVFKLIVDRACLQSERESFIYALGLAIALNFIPSLFVKGVFDAKYKLSRGGKAVMAVSLSAFVFLYFAMLYVRFCYFDMYLPSGNTGGITNTLGGVSADVLGAAAAEAVAGREDIRKAISMTLLTAVSPLVTSVICGFISYYTADPLKAMLREREIRRRELQAELHRIDLAMEAYSRSDNELKTLDSNRYEAAQLAIHDRCAALQARAMLRLEEHVGRADATSKLSDEAMKKAGACVDGQLAAIETVSEDSSVEPVEIAVIAEEAPERPESKLTA